MNLRAFNATGISEVHNFLDGMKVGESSGDADGLLTDDTLSEDLGIAVPRVPKTFETRFHLAVWLNQWLGNFLDGEPQNPVGYWTWLSVLLLDMVAPPRANGQRRIGERARYVLEPDNWQRYYRHLLAGPCRIVRAHWDEMHITRAILAGTPDSPGDLYEQIAARQEVVTSAPLLRLTKRLYWDDASKTLVRGAAGKGAGAARRLAGLLMQFDLTWDLPDVPDEALAALLPRREFARFLRD